MHLYIHLLTLYRLRIPMVGLSGFYDINQNVLVLMGGGCWGKCFKPTNHDMGCGGRGIDYNNSPSVNYFSTLNISLYISFFHHNVYNIEILTNNNNIIHLTFRLNIKITPRPYNIRQTPNQSNTHVF